ncbi:MAG: hypothetical protein JOZ17_26660, partial [Acetobacteraceae bacterium]|nr:hypothetical protein [Acetobacteraceae bacterium]
MEIIGSESSVMRSSPVTVRLQYQDLFQKETNWRDPLGEWTLIICLVAGFAMLIRAFRFTDQLGEPDLYRVLLGILNGRATGLWLDDPLQYGSNFGYGYIQLLYWISPPATLASPELLIRLINKVGYCAAVMSVAFLCASLRAMYGIQVALLGTILFAFSPLFLDLATSGHPILLALTFFFAANSLFALGASGWKNVARYIAAAVILFAGL